jgi:hypothetical protein
MTTISSRRFGGVHAIILFGVVATLWACTTDETDKGGALPPADCQQDSVLIVFRPRGGESLLTVTAKDMPLARRIANLPEYHDCQRFIVRDTTQVDSMTYGPLVSIWAADSLADRLPTESLEGSSLAFPVAVIYNAEPQILYKPLGIHPGFSCLYLRKAGGAGWRAAIVRLNGGPGGCNTAVVANSISDSAWGQLEVRPSGPPEGLTAEDIPEVARWDWDDSNKAQYIGIRCGGRWCEIGAPGFKPSPGALGSDLALDDVMALPDIRDRSDGADRMIIRAFSVKGWYDEQRLDLPAGTPSEPPRLTNIVGTAFPHPTLDGAKFENGDWTTVAYLKVSAHYGGVVPLRKGISRLQMCKGDATECGVDPPKQCSLKDQDPGELWWGRTISEVKDTSAVGCVLRRDHEGQAIPAAAARWNWSEWDAKTWAACQGGCCVLN